MNLVVSLFGPNTEEGDSPVSSRADGQNIVIPGAAGPRVLGLV